MTKFPVKGGGLAVAALLLNALVWGVSWWPFKILESQGLHPLWATALIYGLSLCVVFALRPQALRGWKQHPWLWLLLLSSGLTNVGFNWAVTIGDVVRVVLLFYLMPAWSILIAWWLLGEKPTRMAGLRLILALTGVAIVLKRPDIPWPVPESTADGLALMGGFCFALTNALLLKLHDSPEPARMLAMFGGGALMATCTGLAGVGLGTITPLPEVSLTWAPHLLALSLAFLIGNLALQYGAAKLSAQTTALVMLSEILFASLSSVWLGNSQLSVQTLWGGSLIVCAAILSIWPNSRHT
ncbi:DMT family transporter [Limnohabitans sp. Rim8]|uniref:DMT family transporter n=1 Tax=Limnohabitans sp. Rim8 TaxID=1100718 RepID=UPI002621B7B8|nr:DMT family transporter [Limnohabitans sp. Rim8]